VIEAPAIRVGALVVRGLRLIAPRLSQRYGGKAEEFVQIEVGHASQNILLQAAALGLAAVPVGSLDPSQAAATLALPSDQTVLYLIPVGHVP
jgi:nitroreductase